MSSASRASAGAVVLTWSPPRRDGSLLGVVVVPGRGRFLGSEFDSTLRLRHFPGYPRRPREIGAHVEKRLMVLRHVEVSAWLEPVGNLILIVRADRLARDGFCAGHARPPG